MSRNKVYSDGISVPFKWEKHPGISKESSSSSSSMIESEDYSQKKGLLSELPPPPFHVKKAAKSEGMSPVDGKDPFLMALKECTKSKRSSSGRKLGVAGGGKLEVGLFGLNLITKNLLRGSCKHSIAVRDDAFTHTRC